jgi:hypothetical protein
MTNIDRRRLLTSLAAATVCAPALSIDMADASPRRGAIHQWGLRSEGWLLARESRRELTNHAVDFWERDFCDIAYTQYLPPEITRCAMGWHKAFDGLNRPTLETIDRSMKYQCRNWVGRRRFAAHLDGVETLSSTLQSLIAEEASNSMTRTAFLSLDSLGPSLEPDWAQVLPAFRSCYDRIIGHFHIPQRGLRQWRKFLNGHLHSKSGRGYFQEFFTDAAAQCDAVILTSSALCERDFRCCPYASTEELVGKLMRHLGCALLTPAVLERVVGAGGAGTRRKPRLFALASLGLWTMDDYYLEFPRTIGWQSALVQGSFGDAVPDERPLFVATAVEDLQSDLVEEIRREAGESFFTTATPAYAIENRRDRTISYTKMITLWPFEFDEEKLRSA